MGEVTNSKKIYVINNKSKSIKNINEKSYGRCNDMKGKYEWLKPGHIGRMESTVDAGLWVKA